MEKHFEVSEEESRPKEIESRNDFETRIVGITAEAWEERFPLAGEINPLDDDFYDQGDLKLSRWVIERVTECIGYFKKELATEIYNWVKEVNRERRIRMWIIEQAIRHRIQDHPCVVAQIYYDWIKQSIPRACGNAAPPEVETKR